MIIIKSFSKKKLDLEDKKFKIENQGYEILKRSKKEKLEEEHQLKFGGYIDLRSLDGVEETPE